MGENNNLPTVIGDDKFIGEFHDMDLSPIRDGKFMVAINTGDRDSHKFLCSTVHGPYDFCEMVELAGTVWSSQQLHVKVYKLSQDWFTPSEIVEKNTIDYIEAKWDNILMEEILLSEEKKYDCKAGLLNAKKVAEEDGEKIPTKDE